jgi:hypothetical protein
VVPQHRVSSGVLRLQSQQFVARFLFAQMSLKKLGAAFLPDFQGLLTFIE